jgi:hypothetical protein
MKKLMVLATTAAAMVATPAFAATTIVPQDNTATTAPVLTFTDGTATATFGATYTVNGQFSDRFFFTLNQLATLVDGKLTTAGGGNRAPFNGDLDISVVNLLTGTSTLFSFNRATGPGTTDKNENFTIPSTNMNQQLAAGTYSLMVTGLAENVGTGGNERGTYDGSLTFSAVNSAVPEPATWAMMLGGFGLVGGAMRSARRRRGGKVAYATA